MILFLHGAGERGTRVEDVARHGLARLLSDHAIRSEAEVAIGRDVAVQFIVVAPQCPSLEVWNDDGLLALLTHVERDYDVDARRVYVTGMSMGGFGAWSLGLRHPQRFAAIAPVCGGGRLADVAAASSRQPAALQRLGVWTFHGAKDRVVPAEESQRMFDALEAAGVRDTRLTVYPDIGHDAWNAAYGNPELYAWLLTQTL